MTSHDRAIELGAAAFDFRLTLDERNDLDRHLATCAECRGEIEGMADDARRFEARRTPRLSPSSAAAIRRSIERPAAGINPAMVLVAAVLLLIATWAAATVGAQLLRQLDERLSFDPVPSTDVSYPSGSPGTSVPATPWTLDSLGETRGIPFDAVAVAGSELGWIAVGNACAGSWDRGFDCAAAVASSIDGRNWSESGEIGYATRYLPPTSGPEAGIVDVAGGPDGFVAIGYAHTGGVEPVLAFPEGAAWWSADGSTWAQASPGEGARPAAVFRAAERWLIGGVVYHGTDLVTDRPIGAIWTSVDGRTWTRVEDEVVFDVGGYVDTMEDPAAGGVAGFASNGHVIVAGGQVCADEGLPCTAASWVSADGTSWSRGDELPEGDAMNELVAVGGVFVAGARVCPAQGECTTTILRSTDGRVWRAVAGPLTSGVEIVASEGTAVLVTGEYRTIDVRASADGLRWSELGTVAAPERVNWGTPLLVTRPGGRVDLLIRMDPVDDAASETDGWTALWQIAPASSQRPPQ